MTAVTTDRRYFALLLAVALAQPRTVARASLVRSALQKLAAELRRKQAGVAVTDVGR